MLQLVASQCRAAKWGLSARIVCDLTKLPDFINNLLKTVAVWKVYAGCAPCLNWDQQRGLACSRSVSICLGFAKRLQPQR